MKDTDSATSHEGWEAHNPEQLRRLGEVPLAEKLQWMEEADDVVRNLERQNKQHHNPHLPRSDA